MDNEKVPMMSEQTRQKISEYVEAALLDYGSVKEEKSVEQWLSDTLKDKLSEASKANSEATASNLLASLRTAEEMKQSLMAAVESGRSKESWFSSQTVRALTGMEPEERDTYWRSISGIFLDEGAEGDSGNEMSLRSGAQNIARQLGVLTLQNNSQCEGFSIFDALTDGQDSPGKKLVEQALTSGEDFEVKTVVAGALQLLSDNGELPELPVGTGSDVFSNISFRSVGGVEIAMKVADGELTLQEGLDQLECNTVSSLAGMICAKHGTGIGAKIGAAIGSVFGPVGTAVGTSVGAALGRVAGSKIGQKIGVGLKKIADKARNCIREVGKRIREATPRFIRAIVGWFA